jgi:hypothetical protein
MSKTTAFIIYILIFVVGTFVSSYFSNNQYLVGIAVGALSVPFADKAFGDDDI